MDDNKLLQNTRKRRGQTLAEFAITLPLLLVLIFGIIEFGRLFQAWVTLQNAAREATRYATTGNYNTEKYDWDVVIPCVEGNDDRGAPGTFDPNPDPAVTGDLVEIYAGGQESIFATWYDGQDCDPGNPDHEQRRKDVLRVLSIFDEARRGATGIAMERDFFALDLAPPMPGEPAQIGRTFLENEWMQPRPRSDQQGWFHVMVCSSREFLNPASAAFDTRFQSRFVTALEDDVRFAPSDALDRYGAPLCLLNEVQPPEAQALDNAGTRWLDPGAPGDRVTVVVTFNHPLITPLGVAEYVQMRAIRAGVNESFRASRALPAADGSQLGAISLPSATPIPPTHTLPPSATPTITLTPSPSPTASETPEPAPVDCELITVENVSFYLNRFEIEITNENWDNVLLTAIDLYWPDTPGAGEIGSVYPDMYMQGASLNSEVHWVGAQFDSPWRIGYADQGVFATSNPNREADIDRWDTADRTVYGQGVAPDSSSRWEGVFSNGPPRLSDYVTQWDFGGSTFVFYDPETDQFCTRILELPPEPQPTIPPTVPPDATATYTPNCASESMRVDWLRDSFQRLGVVKLRVTNNRYDVAPFTGFDINWPDPGSLSPPLSPGILQLEKVTVGGRSPNDPETVVVWQGPDNSPSTRAFNPETSGLSGGNEGGWIVDYVFPPRSETFLYFDFSGTGDDLEDAFGIDEYQFNGTLLEINCGRTGGSGGGGGNGGGGGGGSSSGPIFLATAPSPPPPPPPTFTFTPGPPPTITNTPRPVTATYTRTPGPTRVPPTDPPPPTNPPQPTLGPPPTSASSGGGDGGG